MVALMVKASLALGASSAAVLLASLAKLVLTVQEYRRARAVQA